jgi:hypothetical protein
MLFILVFQSHLLFPKRQSYTLFPYFSQNVQVTYFFPRGLCRTYSPKSCAATDSIKGSLLVSNNFTKILKIKLRRSRDAFALMTDAANYKIKITEMALYVRKSRSSNEIL